MSNCFSCGKGFKGDVNDLLRLFKQDYLDRGVERYFFKLSAKGDVLIVKKQQFKRIFNVQIKPNFKNGAEYAHIKEYGNT